MGLKERRNLLGFTQKQIAERLHTTQQTVARWEAGGDIPNAALKDLSLILECSVDELLGVMPLQTRRRKKGTFAKKGDRPYGTLALRTEVGDFEYPIGETEFKRLTREMSRSSFNGGLRWLEFSTLNNLMVYCRADAVLSVRLVDDDVEGMPSFGSQLAYARLTQGKEGEELGPVLREELSRLAKTLAPEAEGQDIPWYEAQERLNTMTFRFRSGQVSEAHVTDDIATSLATISNGQDEDLRGAFVLMSDEYEDKLYANLSQLALIEAPEVATVAFWARDHDADDGDDGSG